MTGIVTTTSTVVTVENLADEAAQGHVKFHTLRNNGTTRRIQFLAEGTAEREVAEWVMAQRGEGVTMKAIAAEMHVSVPTVRRMINALLLTWEVEDEAEAILDGDSFVALPTVEGPALEDGSF